MLLKNDRRKRKTTDPALGRSVRHRQIVSDEATAEALIGHPHAHYYEHYAMIVLCSDIVELRPDPK